MYRNGKRRLIYVTGSPHKIEENKWFVKTCKLHDGSRVSDHFLFEFVNRSVLQILEVDIEEMVRTGVKKAYAEVRVPCLVEYAGLIFDRFKNRSYPGGLTKAMWNALDDRFVDETESAGERAIARAAVAYCDGKKINSFVGDTAGTIAPKPRGARKFYWDTVFIPDDPSGSPGKRTYSEIVATKKFGLAHKMEHLSQSTKAMRKLLDYLLQHPKGGLWK
jgi:inosine/xanthosine triphosphate pyrophosphatase family protein